jgi:hypothetical protein
MQTTNRKPQTVVIFALDPQGRKRKVPVRLRGFERRTRALRFRRNLRESYPDAFIRVYDSYEQHKYRFPR